MQIRRLDAATIALEAIDPFCARLLQNIPDRADPAGNPAAEARLFSTPTHGADPETDAEWREYVEPDLRQLFQDAVQAVRNDLRTLAPADHDGDAVLRLPVSHLEAWIHALNQARLTLAARFEFSETDMEDRVRLDADPRAQALFEVRFYGLLQEFFLGQLDHESE